MKRLLLFVLILTSFTASMAQDTARWSLNLGATALFRDAEYFLPFTKGYTLSGFRVSPTLQYHQGCLAFEGGALLTAVAGTDGLYKAEPVLTISYRPSDWLTLNMGTLKGGNLLSNAQHEVGEPMLDYERWFLHPKEDGVQILTECSSKNGQCRWASDTWVDWEHFFLPSTPDQERFTLGMTQHLEYSGLALNAAFMGSHRGGQFSTLDTCIETLFNERLGLEMQWWWGDGKMSNNALSHKNFLVVYADAYFFQNASPTAYTAYTVGRGLYPHIDYRHAFDSQGRRVMAVDVGYWHGDQYLSARGSWLYQSASWHDPTYGQPLRHMLTASVALLCKSKNSPLNLDLNAQLYHDLDLHCTDFAFSLILHFQASHRMKF